MKQGRAAMLGWWRKAVVGCAIVAIGCGETGGSSGPSSPVATLVTLTPSTATLDRIGASQQFTATVLDQNGAVMTAPIAWTSSNAQIATVNGSGLVTALAVGATEIRATTATVQAAAQITVIGPVSVVIVSASQQGRGQTSRVTVSLSNGGGSGFYRLEFWSSSLTPFGTPVLLGATDPIDVRPGYAETLTYDVPVLYPGFDRVHWLVVYSRPSGSGQYVQTARWNF